MRKYEKKAMELLSPYPVLYKIIGGAYRVHRKINIINRVKFTIEYRIVPLIRCIIKNRYMREIVDLKDSCKGKRCFIIATGPSVLEDDIKKLRDEILIGVNSSITLCESCDIVLDYYLAGDATIMELFEQELNGGYAENIFHEISWLKYRKKMSYNPFFYSTYAKGIWWYPSIDSGDKTTMKHIEIPKDFSKGFCISRTISFIAMQLAVLLGFSEIYLYGFDHIYAKKGHFNEDKFVNAMDYDISDNKRNELFFRHSQVSYEVMKKYCDAHDITIYNATRGGHLDVFQRINFDDISF